RLLIVPVKTPVLDVAGHADKLRLANELQIHFPPDGILALEELLCEDIVDDNRLRIAQPVLLIEEAPSQKGNLHGMQVIGSDDVEQTLRCPTRRRLWSISPHRNIAIFITQRQKTADARRLHSRRVLQAVEQLVESGANRAGTVPD